MKFDIDWRTVLLDDHPNLSLDPIKDIGRAMSRLDNSLTCLNEEDVQEVGDRWDKLCNAVDSVCDLVDGYQRQNRDMEMSNLFMSAILASFLEEKRAAFVPKSEAAAAISWLNDNCSGGWDDYPLSAGFAIIFHDPNDEFKARLIE